MNSLMRNLFLVSFAFAAGFLLGGNSTEKKEALTPMMKDEQLDQSLFPNESDPKDESRRILLDFPPENEEEMSQIDTPIMGDDGLLYDDDMLNFEDIFTSLETLQNHTDDEDFLDMENIFMDEDITEVPTEEEKEEPEAFLVDGAEYMDSLDYERKLGSKNFHTPLACNEGVEHQACTTSFRTLIENSNENEVLVIPCGECIVVDYDDGSERTLPNGLSIEGKLYIPSTAFITFRTKFVWVAGILEVNMIGVDNLVFIHC
jgi:hypothetical protein